MSTILVVDDMAMCREPIAEALRRQGYGVISAGGGTEALEALREQKLDLVLLDVTMPDPDGLAVLQIMRRHPILAKIPVVLLTDRAEKDIVAQAAKCGVQGYLLKANFSLDNLLARVHACIGGAKPPATNSPHAARHSEGNAHSAVHQGTSTSAQSTPPAHAPTEPAPSRPVHRSNTSATPAKSLRDLTPIIAEEKLAKLVSAGLKLKPLAATVHNVIATTGSASCCAADVAKAVSSDQALCLRLLKLANSSAYSRGHPVDNIQTAVQRIGIQEVRKLVTTLGVMEQYAGQQSTRIDIHLFWEHSIACGLIAAAIARECRFKGADDCFLWGTVHDMGRLILLDQVPDEYNQVCQTADELALPLEAVESKLLLLNHCEILKQALNHWQFPQAFISPVANHHETVHNLRRLGPEHAQAATIIALANRIAHALLLGCSGNEMIYPFDDLVETLGIKPTAIERIVEHVPDEARELKLTMLAHSESGIWPDFADIVRKRLDVPIRPLCANSEPAVDALGLFLGRVAEHDDTAAPNVGIINLRAPREATARFLEYEKREANAECGPLPLIVVCQKGANKLSAPPWRTRRHATLGTPTSIARFLQSLNEIIAEVAMS